jgi:hypothetical protein
MHSFRYLRRMRAATVRGGKIAIFAFVMAAFATSSCHRRPKTPDEAYRQFSAAVTAQDGAALFDALDQPTRWAWMSIQKFQREAYDIVLSNFPDSEREREAKRFEGGATATSARELFRAHVAPGVLPMFVPLVAADARVEQEPGGAAAAAVLASGARVPLARGDDGSWGFAGLAKEAEAQKVRAYHDLEVVRASAADYERAATRAGK